MSTSSYRQDIDGLRAIAALAVVLYHLEVPFLPGGFVGVDIFFVISGYLITKNLTLELERDNSINLWDFYLRRARRLLPVLYCTLLLSSVVAVILFSAPRLLNFGAALLHATLSVSNIYFLAESGYFDSSSHLKPLLHTWALGVEGQFYLLWPLIIIVSRRSAHKASPIFMLAGGLSLLLAEIYLKSHPAAVFFLTPFRVFEFAIGAALVHPAKHRSCSKLRLEALFVLGFILVGLSLTVISQKTPFPGLSALAPCVGAVLCIYTADAARLGAILRNKLMSSIGLISYSLYLVHWPIVVFYRCFSGKEQFDLVESCLMFIASVFIATLMYRFVEQPFRAKRENNRSFLLSITLFTALLMYMGASIWGTGGWQWRPWIKNHFSVESIKQGKEKRFKTRIALCTKKGWERCDEIQEGAVNALILGDSHAPDALNAFHEAFPTHNFALSTLGGCPPTREIERLTLPAHPDREKCKKLNEDERFNPVFLRQFDYIVINVMLGWYTAEHLRDYLEFLRLNDIRKVMVFGGYLTLKEDLPEIVNRHGFSSTEILNSATNYFQSDEPLKTYTKKAGYLFLSKRESLCKGVNCRLFDNNTVPFTYDTHHLSYEFAVKMIDAQREDINRLLSR